MAFNRPSPVVWDFRRDAVISRVEFVLYRNDSLCITQIIRCVIAQQFNLVSIYASKSHVTRYPNYRQQGKGNEN
ncbi:hypothetical protein PILCRDRAFT_823555 [Piloderma croceum F 1598]|uniref:Uncharacterized protein n=1 Tax=Piloderma croceum (strain F 1598) TaxID=765440 RepID=A0A0C3AZ64_PILCF|nr:hypothetical protein PILCRDRAFT_823555 [Piloderma croceum F 1598]